MPEYIVPKLFDGWRIDRRETVDETTGQVVRRYFLQRLQADGSWHDERGPYRQYAGARKWLETRHFQAIQQHYRAGDTVIYPLRPWDIRRDDKHDKQQEEE